MKDYFRAARDPPAMGGKYQQALPQAARAVGCLFWTGRATLYPNFHLGHRIWPGEGWQCAAIARIPAPADKIVVRDVIEKRFEGPSAILLGIFDLPAKLARGASREYHLMFRRRKPPLRITRRHVRAGKIRGLMAGIAAHPVHSVAVLAAFYVLKMHMAVISLKGRVACGVTILAARRS